jgi:NADPH-dependent glutamate synthase beta subunit-like oxidoreductase
MGDYILEKANEIIKPTKTDTNKRVAIIGSGPAGLSAAYFLRMSGHRVTVFDRMEEPGGMLTYGIPAYRLPKDIVRCVIKMIENTGVEFKLKVNVGVKDLKKDFDSVFLASGAWRQPSIGLEGEELTKSGLEFLTHVNCGVQEVPGKRVLVVGGGNVAVDVGITALRLGAEQVTLVCLESREEMPALEWEIEQAIEEGVKLMPSWGPCRVLQSDGKVKGIELVRCTSVFDNEGHFVPTFDNTIKEKVEVDQIIMAVGQTTDLSFIDPELSLKIDRGLIVVDQETKETNIPGIFAGGDIATGPATVIEAISVGRRGAITIDLYLRGAEAQAEAKEEKTAKPFLKFNSEYLKRTDRVKISKLPLSERNIEVEDIFGLSLNEIEMEANRCFNCGCVAVNSSDIAVALLALDAKIKIAGSRGIRIIPIAEFCGSLRNSLERDEIVTEIQIPKPLGQAKQTFLKFTLRKPIDFAIVSLASVIHVEGGVCKAASISLGAVAPIPIRAVEAEQAIKGKVINALTAGEAAEAAVRDTVTLSMNAYKVEITKTLVKRAILS